MNRYKSSQKWRKVMRGWYESPLRSYQAVREHDKWWLYRSHGAAGWEKLDKFLTLADCQEHAERLERGQQAAWWGFREGAKKANDASV